MIGLGLGIGFGIGLGLGLGLDLGRVVDTVAEKALLHNLIEVHYIEAELEAETLGPALVRALDVQSQ
jgi:hypothetical protein